MKTEDLVQYVLEHPWFTIIQLIVALCISTRLWTKGRIYRASDQALSTAQIPIVPYWIPLIGDVLGIWSQPSSKLLATTAECQSSVFATTIYGRKYVVLTNQGMVGQLHASKSYISSWVDAATISKRFYAAPYLTPQRVDRQKSMRDRFAKDSKIVDDTTTLLSLHAYNLISPAQSWVDQSQWERTGEVKVIDSGKKLSVSASLMTLVRDFAAHIMLSPLFGRSFLEANPDFIGDFFYFSSNFSSFMKGLPYWVMPGLGPPAFARERCLRAIDGLVAAITTEQTGQETASLGDAILYDVEEVHGSVLSAIRHAREEDTERPSIRSISTELLEMASEMTTYYVYEVLWVLIYIYKGSQDTNTKLITIREEIAHLLKVVKPPPSGLPFEDAPQIHFEKLAKDLPKLRATCPTLDCVFKEVSNQEARPFRAFSVSTDIMIAGKGQDRFQLLRGDSLLCQVNYTSVNDLEVMGNENSSVDFLRVRTWMIVSAMVALYEFESPSNGELLEHPGSKRNANSTSMAEPARKSKIKITRRPVD